MVERIAEAVARERVERELPVLGRDGVQTEAARGGRELVEADDEILHVLQLRDAHEHLVELLHGVGQLVADAGVEVADLLIDVHEARDVVRLHEVGQLGEQAVEPAQAAERGHAVGRGVSAVVDALAQRVMLRVREREGLGAVRFFVHRVDGGVDGGVGVGVGGEQRAVAVLILIQQQLEQHLEVADLAGPLVARHMQQVAVGELAERLEQGAGVERAEKELAVKHLGLPEVLVFIVAEAGALAQDAAGREHLRRLADDELHLLGAVRADGHTVEIH